MERVFVDANILYSRTIRDWLFALSTSKIQMFDLFSSEDVFAEVVYHYRRSNPKRSGDEVNGLVNQIRRGASFKNEREIRSGASPVLSVNS